MDKMTANCSFCDWFSQFLRDFETALKQASPEELARFRQTVRERALLAAECPKDRVQ